MTIAIGNHQSNLHDPVSAVLKWALLAVAVLTFSLMG